MGKSIRQGLIDGLVAVGVHQSVYELLIPGPGAAWDKTIMPQMDELFKVIGGYIKKELGSRQTI